MSCKTAGRLMHTTSSSLHLFRSSLRCLQPCLSQLGLVDVGPIAPLSTPSNNLLISRPYSQTASQNLPALPVPPLQKTLDKYLKSVRPLLTDNEYRNTENLVIEFAASDGGVGNKLQHLLEKRASQCDNWLSEWWLNNAYLTFRSPVVVYSNPAMGLPRQLGDGSIDSQIKCAAKVITAALDYKRMVDEGLVPQEMMGKAPLDMSQYSMIFGTCRIPGADADSLTFAPPPTDANAPKHIVVVRNNNFFKLNVYDVDGATALSEHDLVDALNEVVKRSAKLAPAVGVLTADNRNVWAKVYKELRKSASNKRALTEIQKCLFVVSLDKANKNSNLNYETLTAGQLIHGGGVNVNSGNRYFDKTIQFIIGADGGVGVCYEHSPAEGPPIANISDHVMDFLTGVHSSQSVTSSSTDRPQRSVKLDEIIEQLDFDVSKDVAAAIDRAGENLDILVRDLELSCFVFESFGKNFVKSQKLSPDSFIQVAMQLAFYRIHKELGATYETASTRRYLHGRTETVRSATSEALEFCKTMSSRSASLADKRDAMERAVNAHKQYVMDAVQGLGVDRHLLGLKLIAVEKGLRVPELYLDTGYVRSSHFRISSSQVAARHESFMSYGPSVPDGYGCCYNPRNDDMIFGVSAFNSCSDTSAERFGESLRNSLNDMRNVLMAASQKARL